MKWKSTTLVLLLVLLTAVAIYLFRKTSYKGSLEKKVEKLEALNGKLHDNLQALSQPLVRGPLSGSEYQREQFPRETERGAENEQGWEDGCEVIHMSMIVSGSVTIQRLMVLVKSILFYRHNPLHFHFLSDPHSKEVVSTIFETWRLPAVSVTFYPLAGAIEAVRWIPNSHYSGVYALAKLMLPSILPSSLNFVLVLDTDLMLTSNIGRLWAFIKRLQKAKKHFAMVENQSDWYLGNMWKGHKPWPAKGRGFNSGVVLLNLELLRGMDWNGTWNSVAERCLETHSRVALADQDVINAAIKYEKVSALVLPCVWNVQLSENTLSDYCFKSAHDFKIIHWNSAAKVNVQNFYGPHFKNLFQMFENYDSMLVRSYISDCKAIPSFNASDSAKSEGEGPCSDVRQEASITRKVHPFYLTYSYESVSNEDVTLVAQMSIDRLHMLEPLCQHWEGPLSIALYATDADLRDVLTHISSSPILENIQRLALHVVSKSGNFYPVNHLRNIALSFVQTPFVYLSDIDFLPMQKLYGYAQEAARVLGSATKRALIVPAFESLLYKVDFPTNKSQLLTMLRQNSLYTFRYHVWQRGHAQTNYEHWKTAERPYKVKWVEDFEPYFIVNRNVTRYDKRFVGFGWNKVSHVMELAAQGYELVVLPEAFMVHLPHSPSRDITSYRQSKHYRDCMQVLKREFRRELKVKYDWNASNG